MPRKKTDEEKVEKKVAWQPQPKQALALARTEKEILYGGARGGGKTDAGMAFPLYHIGNPLFRALVIRRNADDLKDWIDRATRMYSSCGATPVGSPAEFRFPSGAIIRTGHLNDADAYTKYQGHEYQNMVIEELTQIPREDDYEKLLGSCRSTIADVPAQIFCTTNPDGVGWAWVKNRWNIPDHPNPNNPIITSHRDEVSGVENKLVFVPALIWDNEKLIKADPGYIDYLRSITDPDLRDAWLNGSWAGITVKGAYYGDDMAKATSEGRIKRINYDPALPVHTVWDLGISDAMAIGFFQKTSTELRWVDYLEAEGEGMEYYVRELQKKPYIYGKHFAPHDIEVRDLSTGKSRRDFADALGLKFDVIPNIPFEDGVNAARVMFPHLWFNEPLTAEIRGHLARYHKEFDEKRGVFKNAPVHDASSHGADVLRYAAVVENDMTGDNFDFAHYKQDDFPKISQYEG